MEEYPIGCRVILKDLTKTEFNGRVGVIKTKLNESGRQSVCLVSESKNSDGKYLGLKPINLELEPRPVESLSTREMKTVLSRKDYSGSLAGYDKSELKSLVEAHATCPKEIASILAKAQTASAPASSVSNKSSTGTANTTESDMRQKMKNQAAQLNQLSPEQLRQQAQMMRSMDPSMIRRMDPTMANLTDAQIQMAATQMETMANNPHMIQGKVEQMNNMDDSQLENLTRMQPPAFTGGNGNSTTAVPSATSMPSIPPNSPQSMANMTPEQLRQQANMMKSMPKDTLRSMNPLMASWTDSQIDMAINQMETMANNPEMSKRMMDQMKNMKPEDIQKLQNMAQNGATVSNSSAMSGTGTGFDPAAMAQNPMEFLKNTDPAQIKQMLNMVKDNPSLFSDVIRASNPAMADQLTDEQISKTMESFASMDERKIGWMLTAFGVMQNFRSFVKKRGFLLAFVAFLGIALVLFRRYNGEIGKEDFSTMIRENEDIISMSLPEVEEDEF